MSENNNMKEMREAVEFSVRQMSRAIIDNTFGDDVVYLVGCMKACIDRMNTALAAPPRNCDVGTAHDHEYRFQNFCGIECFDANGNPRCPVAYETDCKFAWAQMPYESDVHNKRRGAS